TDLDVMPDCAPAIIGLLEGDGKWPEANKRRWRAKGDIGDTSAQAAYRKEKAAKVRGQYVETFVSDQGTLEYYIALGPRDAHGAFSRGLGEDVYVAACLAASDDAINSGQKKADAVATKAVNDFAELKKAMAPKNGCDAQEVLASNVYAKFAK